MVVETMKKEHLSIYAAMQEFGINDHKIKMCIRDRRAAGRVIIHSGIHHGPGLIYAKDEPYNIRNSVSYTHLTDHFDRAHSQRL